MTQSNDLFFVLGILAAGLSVPSLLNGWTEGRMPRFGVLMALGGGLLLALAMSRHPGGYGFDDVIPVFRRVFASLLS